MEKNDAAEGGPSLFIGDFPTWFEQQLSSNLSLELHFILTLITTMKNYAKDLSSIATELREMSKSVGAASSQMSKQERVLKLCDQVDSLSYLFRDSETQLPGTSQIAELCRKCRSTMKTIDDMASSSKLARTDTALVDKLSHVRIIIHQIFNKVEQLESNQRIQSISTDYIDYIRIQIREPTLQLLHQNSLLSAQNDTQTIMKCEKNVRDAEAFYNAACISPVFVKWASLKRNSVSFDDFHCPFFRINLFPIVTCSAV
jgi:hypothetical protein